MTLDDEVRTLLREADAIVAAIDAVQAAYGASPAIEAVRLWAAEVRQDVLRTREQTRLWSAAAISGPH